MDRFARMPLDLIPDIIQFAAIDAVRDDPGWVAALARISRDAYTIVRPILYEVVQINALNAKVVCASNSSAFSYTRHLIVVARVLVSIRPPALSNFTHVEAFTGNLPNYVNLAYHNDTFRPHTVSFLGRVDVAGSRLALVLDCWPESFSRIHMRDCKLLTNLAPFMERCIRLTHVTLDPEDAEGLVPFCRGLLALTRLRRLAVRTGRLCPDEAALVAAELAALATDVKEPCLFLDVAHLESVTPRREAFSPQSLWESGCQLYTGSGELVPSALKLR